MTAYSPYEGHPGEGYGYLGPMPAVPMPPPARRRKRKLLAAFIAIVALAAAGFWAANFFLAPKTGNNSATNAATALAADNTLNSSYAKLGDDLTAFGQSTENCGSNLPCAAKLDAQTGRDFKAFSAQLTTMQVPATATAGRARIVADATALTQDFTKLSHATTTAQYAATLSGTGIAKKATAFQHDVTAFDTELKSY